MAKDLNQIILIGRLTKDIDIQYVGSGTAKGLLSVASADTRKQGEEWIDEVSYFDCVLWGKAAEILKQFLNKGQQVAINGKLKQDRWEKDGKKCSKVYVNVDTLQLLGGKKEVSESRVPSETPKFQPVSNDGFPEDTPF